MGLTSPNVVPGDTGGGGTASGGGPSPPAGGGGSIFGVDMLVQPGGPRFGSPAKDAVPETALVPIVLSSIL